MVLQKVLPLVICLCSGVAAVFFAGACAGQMIAAAPPRAQIMQSDEMLKALIWWKQYARTAKDGEQKLRELQAKLRKMGPIQLRQFLLEFQRDRELARRRRAAFEATRQQSVALTRAHVLWQQACKEAALDRSYYGYRDYFGSTRHYYGGYPRYAAVRYYPVR